MKVVGLLTPVITIAGVVAAVGAAMHFAGRKLAPDARWASAAGGVVFGVGSIAVVVIVISVILFVLGWVGAFLSVFSG